MGIGWGIIGCGNVTEVKSGPGFRLARGSALVAVMRRDARLAEDYARRHGVPRWYADAQALIDDPAVDAVYVATPPGSHLEYALRICAAGKPAYIEKPMARNHAECQRMVAAFAAAGVPLFVAYYRRSLARFRIARDLVAGGRLGPITGIACRYAAPMPDDLDPAAPPWRLRAEHAGGGLFLDLASHTLDILDFILGPLRAVSGTAVNLAGRHAVEDGVAMRFTTGDGALGTASWNFAAGARTDRIEISGRDGELTLATFGDEPLLLRSAGSAATSERISAPNPRHIQQPLIQDIVDELLGRGHAPSTGVTAARTSLVMDLALDTYYGTRSDDFWTRPDSWPGRPRLTPTLRTP